MRKWLRELLALKRKDIAEIETLAYPPPPDSYCAAFNALALATWRFEAAILQFILGDNDA